MALRRPIGRTRKLIREGEAGQRVTHRIVKLQHRLVIKEGRRNGGSAVARARADAPARARVLRGQRRQRRSTGSRRGSGSAYIGADKGLGVQAKVRREVCHGWTRA